MSEWTSCLRCGLKHRIRPDGQCPRCATSTSSATDNPFATPQSAADYVPETERFTDALPADRMSRLGARMFDGFIDMVAAAPGIVWMVVVFSNNPDEPPDSAVGGAMMLMIVAVVAVNVYQWYLLARDGQTLGKKLVNVRIVSIHDDSNPGFVHTVLLRNWVNALFQFVPLVGGLYPLVDVCFIFGEERRCLHDLIASTKVVDA